MIDAFADNLEEQLEGYKPELDKNERLAQTRAREAGIKEEEEQFKDKSRTLKLQGEIKDEILDLRKELDLDKHKKLLNVKEMLNRFTENIEKIERGQSGGVPSDYPGEYQTSLVAQRHGHNYMVLSHDDYFPVPEDIVQQFTELNRSFSYDTDFDANTRTILEGSKWKITYFSIQRREAKSDD